MKKILPILMLMTSKYATPEDFDCINYRDEDNQCVVLVKGDSFASAFPVKNKNKTYEWNVSKSHPEYYWETEIGRCVNGDFLGKDHVYTLFSSNAHDLGKKESGSMEALLLNRNSQAVFYNKKNPKEDEERNVLKDAIINASIVPEGALVIYSSDISAKKNTV